MDAKPSLWTIVGAVLTIASAIASAVFAGFSHDWSDTAMKHAGSAQTQAKATENLASRAEAANAIATTQNQIAAAQLNTARRHKEAAEGLLATTKRLNEATQAQSQALVDLVTISNEQTAIAKQHATAADGLSSAAGRLQISSEEHAKAADRMASASESLARLAGSQLEAGQLSDGLSALFQASGLSAQISSSNAQQRRELENQYVAAIQNAYLHLSHLPDFEEQHSKIIEAMILARDGVTNVKSESGSPPFLRAKDEDRLNDAFLGFYLPLMLREARSDLRSSAEFDIVIQKLQQLGCGQSDIDLVKSGFKNRKPD